MILYSNESGTDELMDYSNLQDAISEGKQIITSWGNDYCNNGFVIYNKENKIIEFQKGYFPIEISFSNEILIANGITPKKLNETQKYLSEILNTLNENNLA